MPKRSSSTAAARHLNLREADHRLLDRVAAVIRELESDAQIVLYGSRARDDARPDSDWDLLVLLDGAVDTPRQDRLRRRDGAALDRRRSGSSTTSRVCSRAAPARCRRTAKIADLSAAAEC
jgi:tRNA nucleotidyltransferase (CCA-adding enzyme)